MKKAVFACIKVLSPEFPITDGWQAQTSQSMIIGNPARFRTLYLPNTNQESNRFTSLFRKVLC
jgi:hypothetical protein